MRLLLLLTLGCSQEPEDTTPGLEELTAEVASPGPQAVGYTQATVTYRPVASTEDRVLPVEIWYPAVDGGEGPATYLTAGIAAKEAPLALDAPAPAASAAPVAVYSHGSGGLGLIAWPFAERLASHGWIVISADHVGNTSLDLISGAETPFIRTLLNRPLDVRAQLDALEAGLLDLPADLERVFVFGHSFGGYTTLAVGGAGVDVSGYAALCAGVEDDPDCALLTDPAVVDALATGLGDPRVDAIAPQAPALYDLFGDAALAGISVPVLLQSAGRDITTTDEAEARPIWRALDGAEDRWVRIPDGGHYSFISVCDDIGIEVIDMFQPGSTDDGCGPDFTPTLETVPTLATYLTAFARAAVLGETEYAAVADAALHPGFKVERKE